MKPVLLLALLLLAAVCTKAQIIYTDVKDTTISPWSEYSLTIGNAGFEIWAHPGTVDINTFDDNACLLGSASGTFYPYAMQANQKVDTNASAWKKPNYANLCNNGGFWNTSQDRYLGVRFVKQGRYHYGWIRLSVNTATASFTLKDFAYNNTPDKAIVTGSGMSSISSVTAIQASVYPNPLVSSSVLQFEQALSNATLTVYNSIGDIVLSSSGHAGSTIAISRGNMAPGVYIAAVQGNNRNIAYIRFMVE